MSSKVFKCRVLVGGDASEEALFCRQAFAFDRAVDPRTGTVLDARSGMAGANIRVKVLFYGEARGLLPGRPGSSRPSGWAKVGSIASVGSIAMVKGDVAKVVLAG